MFAHVECYHWMEGLLHSCGFNHSKKKFVDFVDTDSPEFKRLSEEVAYAMLSVPAKTDLRVWPTCGRWMKTAHGMLGPNFTLLDAVDFMQFYIHGVMHVVYRIEDLRFNVPPGIQKYMDTQKMQWELSTWNEGTLDKHDPILPAAVLRIVLEYSFGPNANEALLWYRFS